jgi:hypothetical protein
MNEFLDAIISNVHKGKGCPMTCLCKHREEVEAQLEPIHNHGPRKGWVVSTMLQPLYPWEIPTTNWTGALVGLKDRHGKCHPHQDLIQPVVSCYTDHAILTIN